MPVIVHLMAFTCKWMSNGLIWSRRLKFFWFFFCLRRLRGSVIYWLSMRRYSGHCSRWTWIRRWRCSPQTLGIASHCSSSWTITSEMMVCLLINFCWVVNSGKMYWKPWMDMGCQNDNYQYWKWQGLKWQLLKMYIGCFD